VGCYNQSGPLNGKADDSIKTEGKTRVSRERPETYSRQARIDGTYFLHAALLVVKRGKFEEIATEAQKHEEKGRNTTTINELAVRKYVD
jgi:hypothetical protein